jgi:hypothetical protein
VHQAGGIQQGVDLIGELLDVIAISMAFATLPALLQASAARPILAASPRRPRIKVGYVINTESIMAWSMAAFLSPPHTLVWGPPVTRLLELSHWFCWYNIHSLSTVERYFSLRATAARKFLASLSKRVAIRLNA